MSTSRNAVECLVIGGGLAGSMAAWRLAEAGRDVLLVERETGPRPKVCGEFLSAEAIGYLRRCGVDPLALGAQPVNTLRFAAGQKTIETLLPFPALALSRAALDEQLLRHAAARGCCVVRGVRIERLEPRGHHWHAFIEDGRQTQASHVFLASGKHDLRGWARPPGGQNDLVGFKMHWRLTSPEAKKLHGAIELFLFRGGYGGLVCVEDGWANLSLVVRQSVLQKMRGWPGLLQHACEGSRFLKERLGGADPAWERPFAISPIPYGYIARQADRCWRLGDQVAVIPSFTGDGMAIALHSAALAAEMFLTGGQIEEYQQLLTAQLRRGIRLATILSQLMASSSAPLVAPVAMRVLPFFLNWIATATRIPHQALLIENASA